ncbi:hypothetical protein DPX16_15123 [Anabarilius grahami]|uniref:VWA7 N-terminal domain-containing protein n=1 Tax=Anabarilius grahami TaxID=495550 RepID=A0A3N0YX28_ANAGA|nr:hypothetical protein DPX16_15123 [Anabarilius grahami]
MISFYNVMRDVANIPGQHPEEHFDNEKFQEGKESITSGIKAITEKEMETCDNSSNSNSENIKESIIKEKFLTSGYARRSRPKGKCSHGGFPDYPEGINKDYRDSSHGSLHNQAADVAIDACVQLLEKILRSLKKEPALNFLRLMGLHSEKPKGEWKPLISFLDFKLRYPDASEDEYVEV